MNEVSEAIQNWKKLAEEFHRIDMLTAKIAYQKLQEIRKLSIFQVVFCRSSKPCESKIKKYSTANRKNCYRVCAFPGNCNQQTNERQLAKEKP